MINATDLTGKFALDVTSVEALKQQARNNPDKALRSTAAQFEALLMQMMMKSMREAADSAGSTDSQDTKTYKSMLDQQLTMALSKRGMGLADVMVRQLGRSGAAPEAANAPATPAEAVKELQGKLAGQQMEAALGIDPENDTAPLVFRQPPRFTGPTPEPILGFAPANPPVTAANAAANAPAAPISETARGFIGRLWPHAVDAARTTGIAPHFILGQAALESGWGRGEIRTADGSTSHNLFGIKAGSGWTGATADVVTTEYVNGAPVKSVERFRSYASYADAFRDYASLLAANPRYAQVLNERSDPAAFARGLQQAGYATDPNYADKLTRVITGTVMRAGLTS